MPRRLPSDAVLLVLAMSTIALVIGATLLLHAVFVDGAHGQRAVTATVATTMRR